MNTFNAIFSSIFDLALGWFGGASGYVDIILWSVAGGIVALMVYKTISNQAGIERAKNGIKVHLLEIRLFPDDIVGVLVSTAQILVKNALYIGHNIMPMVVMFVPMMAILFQLEANYALDPLPVGGSTYLTVEIDRDTAPDLQASSITIETPVGMQLAGMVPKADAVGFRLTDLAEGEHVVKIHMGDEVVEKLVAVGGGSRKIPFMRTKSWEGYLYPGDEGLEADSAAYTVKVHDYPDSDLGPLSGEGGVLMGFFVLSLAAGIALKGVFGVTL